MEVFCIQVEPSVDLSHIIQQTLEMFEQGTHYFTNEKYFSFYTNNIPMAIIVYWVFYLGKVLMGEAFNYSIAGGLFNVIMLWIGIFSFYGILDRVVKNYKTAVFFKFLMLINPVFMVYAPYYYTDTVAVPLSILAVLCMLKAYQSTGIKKYGYIFAAGALFATAFKIRVVTLIILIAIVMGLIYKKCWRGLIKLLPILVSAFLIVELIYGVILDYHVKFDTKENAVPVTHFMMMGSHDNGTYDSDDVKYTKSFKDRKQRAEKTWEAYCDNLKENGMIGNIVLILKKEAMWGVGTRGYYQYVATVKKETWLYQFIAGKYQRIIRAFLQAYNFWIMMFMCLGLLKSRKKLSVVQLILMIFLGGTIIFTALWEAHPRHIMTYMPFIILMGIPFGEYIFEKHTVSYDSN